MMTTHPVTLNGGWAAAAATDLIGIFDAVDVPIVVVRRDLLIACFNKVAAAVLGLSPSDVGRAPRDIAVLAGFRRLEDQCRQVIANGVESRADWRDRDKWFVVRIAPCTTGDLQVAGTSSRSNVVSAHASIRPYTNANLQAILNTVSEPLVVLGADQRIGRAIAPSTPRSGHSR
jgi:hypothetical protein